MIRFPHGRRTALIVWGVAIAVAIGAPATAHIHHGSDGTSIGWYPADCCRDGDCRPVASVRSSAGGLLLTTEDGATLFVNAQRPRRPSRDARWHICYGAFEDPTIRCIFEPVSS